MDDGHGWCHVRQAWSNVCGRGHRPYNAYKWVKRHTTRGWVSDGRRVLRGQWHLASEPHDQCSFLVPPDNSIKHYMSTAHCSRQSSAHSIWKNNRMWRQAGHWTPIRLSFAIMCHVWRHCHSSLHYVCAYMYVCKRFTCVHDSPKLLLFGGHMSYAIAWHTWRLSVPVWCNCHVAVWAG